MKQHQMNVYARFIVDEPRTEAEQVPTKARRTTSRTAAGVRSPKPGLKKRTGLPK
jgi:hypothetical protein